MKRARAFLRLISALMVVGLPMLAAAKEIVSKAESGGLVIEVSCDDSFAVWTEFEVTCRVTNTTNAAIPFVVSSEARGFSLELLDDVGLEVPVRPQHARLFVDYEKAAGRLQRVDIRPQSSVVFAFRPVDVFQVGRPTGYRLRVRWGPTLGLNGVRRPMDNNLVVEMRFPTDTAVAREPTAIADVELSKGSSPFTNQMPPAITSENREKAISPASIFSKESRRFWIVITVSIVVTLIVVTIAARIVRRHSTKRRNRDD